MITGSFVNLAQILERVDADKPANATYNLFQIKIWVGDVLRDISTIEMMDSKIHSIKLVDGRGLLPNEIVHVIAVKASNSNLIMKKSSAVFEPNKDTYYIRGQFIYVNNNVKSIDIITSDYVLDEKGNPMIPDNQYVISAVVSKILERMCKRLWDNGQMMRANYDAYEQDYLYHLKSATVEALMPTVDDIAGWDSLHTIMLRGSSESHSVGYTNLDSREVRVNRDNR